MSRTLTEKQEKFLDALFGEARGDPTEAKKLAGYSSNYSTARVVEGLEEEIEKLTRRFISAHGPQAAYAMVHVLNKPTDLGNKDRMTAAKDILDRAGLRPTEKVEVQAESPLFILPPKASQDDET